MKFDENTPETFLIKDIPANRRVNCILDFETYSERSIKGGAYAYSSDPSSDIVCLAFMLADEKGKSISPCYTWTPKDGKDSQVLLMLRMLLIHPRTTIVAHNAFFEQCIIKNVLTPKYFNAPLDVKPEKFFCTMHAAMRLAIPRKLDNAVKTLRQYLPAATLGKLALGKLDNDSKLSEGSRLMLKYAKPRSYKDGNAVRWDDADEIEKIVEYCEQDINLELALFEAALVLLDGSSFEQRVWYLDQRVNFRGFHVDTELARRVVPLVESEQAGLDDVVLQATCFEVESTRAVSALKRWLTSRLGFEIASLSKASVSELLNIPDLPEDVRDVLETRQLQGKTSVAKYKKLISTSYPDSVVRGALVCHAASTGRWGGALFQPQNLPRPLIAKDTGFLCDLFLDDSAEDLIKLIYGPVTFLASDAIRGLIKAPNGRALYSTDYSQIEARILFWLAGSALGVKQFKEGRDLYKELATRIYNIDIKDVTDEQRFHGKSGVLGCGFGMGADKFEATYNVKSKIAKAAVDAYRSAYSEVPKFWRKIEDAAKKAVRNPNQTFALGPLSLYMRDGFLRILLPSGRELSYLAPLVRVETSQRFGTEREQFSFFGVDKTKRKVIRQKAWGGVLTENVVQAIARDVMANSALNIENSKDFSLVLTVHDEGLSLGPVSASKEDVHQYEKLMLDVPAWAKDIPIAVSSWAGARYRK